MPRSLVSTPAPTPTVSPREASDESLPKSEESTDSTRTIVVKSIVALEQTVAALSDRLEAINTDLIEKIKTAKCCRCSYQFNRF